MDSLLKTLYGNEGKILKIYNRKSVWLDTMRCGEMKRSIPLHRRRLLARRFFQLERATKFYLADFYGVGFLLGEKSSS